MAGLADSFAEVPDLKGEVPKTPEETAQRTARWSEILSSVQNNPHFMNGVAMFGLQLMQPGATLGQGALAGFQGYNLSKQTERQNMRQDAQDQRLANQDTRAQESHQMQMESQQQSMQQSAEKHPLTMRTLQAQADAIPNEVVARKLRIELEREKIAAERERRPLELQRLQALVANAGKATGTEIAANREDGILAQYMNVERAADPKATDSEIYVRAYEKMSRGSRQAAGANIRMDQKDEEALAIYRASPQATQQDFIAKGIPYEKWARGKMLAESAVGSPATLPAPAAASVPAPAPLPGRNVIRDPKTGQLRFE